MNRKHLPIVLLWGLLFSQFDGTIVKVSPDIYDGADLDKIDEGILTELGTFIKPLAARKTPAVPKFFLPS